MRRAKGEGALIKRKGCRFWYAIITMRRVCNSASARNGGQARSSRHVAPVDGRPRPGIGTLNAKLSYATYAPRTRELRRTRKQSLRTLASGDETIIGLRNSTHIAGTSRPKTASRGNPGPPAIR